MEAKCNRIIFLDVDGPLIPAKMYYNHYASSRFKGGVWRYDPMAVEMISHLCATYGCQIVYNSSHGDLGPNHLTDMSFRNGLGDYLNPTIFTGYPNTTYSRDQAITDWLNANPHVMHWVAVDDFPLKVPNFTKVDFEAGLTLKNFEDMKRFLVK